MVKIYSRN